MDSWTRLLVIVAIQVIMLRIRIMLVFVNLYLSIVFQSPELQGRRITYSMLDKIPKQLEHMSDLVRVSDSDCYNNLRFDKRAFLKLCYVLEHAGGLGNERYVSVQEKVATFLSVLAHHKKIVTVMFDFKRSPSTISKYFNQTLDAVIMLADRLLVSPQPVPETTRNIRWNWFKGCLGALDGTYIKVHVPIREQTKYRTRKGEIATNVLGVCDVDGKFVYVLTGWEGSAADSRVLRDAIHRPNGLRIPNGNYYLCDNGYTNGNGFLTPYRGTRYHLEEWGTRARRPRNAREYFNMKHSRARNVVERTFGVLKMRWAVLRSCTFYPLETQNKIILACTLLHNFIKQEMPFDPTELLVPEVQEHTEPEIEYIDIVEPSESWNSWRDALAEEMWNTRRR